MENEQIMRPIKHIEPIVLNKLFERKSFSWFILGLSVLLMFIENFLKIDNLIGGWNIVSYLLVLTPFVYLVYTNEVKNTYVKWFLPILLVMIVDMFVYSNEMIQTLVPIVFYLLVITLYSTSMHSVHSLYQTLVPHLAIEGIGREYLTKFFNNIFVKENNNDFYRRIGLALLITIPFLGVFIALLFSADERFSTFLTNLVDFNFNFDISYVFTVPFFLFVYLLLFVFTLSAAKERTKVRETQAFDMLIVGIFLGMINLLFMIFLALQLPFLFGDLALPANTTLAEFARQGFFQLMMVMGIVILIFLFIMRRFKGEKVSIFLLSGLLIQTTLMGLVSLKKMYLYQSIKGATVLRYYVEWFDYFLITVLILGLVFLVRKIAFKKLLDMVAILSLLSFTLIISLNVDAMVASHNIEKFKEVPKNLDRNALSRLSIDALPVISKAKIEGSDTITFSKEKPMRYSQEINGQMSLYWYIEPKRNNCNSFATYHYGYCSKLKAYGVK